MSKAIARPTKVFATSPGILPGDIVFSRIVNLARRMDNSPMGDESPLTREPLPITRNEFNDFLDVAVLRFKTARYSGSPIDREFLKLAIMDGRYTLGTHPVVVI